MPGLVNIESLLRGTPRASIGTAAARAIEPPPDFTQLPAEHSFFERFINTLSTPIYAMANIAKGEFGDAGSVLLKGLLGGELTGFAPVTAEESETMSDVLDFYGMEEGWGRSILGFVGDVAFDPLTYLTGGVSAGAKIAFTGARSVAKGAAVGASKEVLERATEKIVKHTLTSAGEKALGKELAEDFFLNLGKKVSKETGEEALEKAGLAEAKSLGYIDPGGINFEVPFFRGTRKNLVTHDRMKGFFGKYVTEGTAEILAKQVSANVAFPIIGGVFSGAFRMLGKSSAFTELVRKIHPTALMTDGDLYIYRGAKEAFSRTMANSDAVEGLFAHVPDELREGISSVYESGGREGIEKLLGEKNLIPSGAKQFLENELFKNFDQVKPSTIAEAWENAQNKVLIEHILMKTDIAQEVKILEETLGFSGDALEKIKRDAYQGKFRELRKVAGATKDRTTKILLERMAKTLEEVGRRENHVFHQAKNYEDFKVLIGKMEYGLDDVARRKVLQAVDVTREAQVARKLFQKIDRVKIYDEIGLSTTERNASDWLLDQTTNEIRKKAKKELVTSKEFRERSFDTFAQGEEVGLIYEKNAVKLLLKQNAMLAEKRMEDFVIRHVSNYSRIGDVVGEAIAKTTQDKTGVLGILRQFGVKSESLRGEIFDAVKAGDDDLVNDLTNRAIREEGERLSKLPKSKKTLSPMLDFNSAQAKIEVGIEGARRIIAGEVDPLIFKSQARVSKLALATETLVGRLASRKAADQRQLISALYKETGIQPGNKIFKLLEGNAKKLDTASEELGKVTHRIAEGKRALKDIGITGEKAFLKSADILSGEVKAINVQVKSLGKGLQKVISSLEKQGRTIEANALEKYLDILDYGGKKPNYQKLKGQIKGLKDATKKVNVVFSARVSSLEKLLTKKLSTLIGKQADVDKIKSIGMDALLKKKEVLSERVTQLFRKSEELGEGLQDIFDRTVSITATTRKRFDRWSRNKISKGEVVISRALKKSEKALERAEIKLAENTIRKNALGKIKVSELNLSPGMAQVVEDLVNVDIPGPLFSAFEKMTNKLLKPFMTVYNPAFHIRNMMSGIFMGAMNPRLGVPEFLRSMVEFPQNVIHAFKLDKVSKKLGLNIGGLMSDSANGLGAYEMMIKNGGKTNLPDDVLEILGKEFTDKVSGAKYTLEDIIQQAKTNGVLDIGFETEITPFLKKGEKSPGVRGFMSDKTKALAGFMNDTAKRSENSMRLTHFLNNVISGLNPSEAAAQTKRWFVDYTPSTAFERRLRAVVPFYKFTKQILAEYGPEIARRPGVIAPYKALYNLNEKDENVPEWMRKSFTVPIGKDNAGNPLYVTGFGLPIEALQNVGSWRSALSMLNPLIKWPLEVGAGKNFFFGSEYASYDAPYQSLLSPAVPQAVRDVVLDKHINKNGETFYTMNPEWREVIDRLPGYRWFATINKIADTRRSFFTNLVNGLTGVNIKALDERQRERVINEKIEQAIKIARRKGSINQYKIFYARGQEPDKQRDNILSIKKHYDKKRKDRKKKLAELGGKYANSQKSF